MPAGSLDIIVKLHILFAIVVKEAICELSACEVFLLVDSGSGFVSLSACGPGAGQRE
ncbi:hypothetical protein SBA1_430014 [Candidatus Sulfotelmatobacter kueseliae]|uniref:Uncharacterized protein n=1 Tax=Candidatus Sulfotelmatobacter kueseliae TaxID=2042962 RepID=A0A2U3KRB6_9BACT|nr:hypothetical protein SBA1_430014 [Candidatus Sulfotelmatobacter kueseliae]